MNLKTTQAKDIMQRDVVTVRPNILIEELAAILDEKRISGCPVVNHYGHLIGVVSKTDLVHHQRGGAGSQDRFAYYRETSSQRLPSGYHVESPDRTEVAEIMTPAIISASEEAPVPLLARLMRRKHIHRVFITEGKKLLGVVSTTDLLKLLETPPRRRGQKPPKA